MFCSACELTTADASSLKYTSWVRRNATQEPPQMPPSSSTATAADASSASADDYADSVSARDTAEILDFAARYYPLGVSTRRLKPAA